MHLVMLKMAVFGHYIHFVCAERQKNSQFFEMSDLTKLKIFQRICSARVVNMVNKSPEIAIFKPFL